VSPSMDIQIPYNLERLLWMANMFDDNNDEKSKIQQCIESAVLMKQFKETEHIKLDSTVRARLVQCCGIAGSSSHNDAVTKETILQVYQNSNDNYVLDPHTAIGVHASMVEQGQRSGGNNESVFCMACAHPSKFPVAIEQALEGMKDGGDKDNKWWWLSDSNHSSVRKLLELDSKNVPVRCEEYERGSNWVERLKEHFVNQTNRLAKEK
jgi:threonine synthase